MHDCEMLAVDRHNHPDSVEASVKAYLPSPHASVPPAPHQCPSPDHHAVSVSCLQTIAVVSARPCSPSFAAHHHNAGADGGPCRVDLIKLGDDAVAVAAAFAAAVAAAVDDALQAEEIRDWGHRLVAALGDATRKRAPLGALRIELHSRYKDRVLDRGVNIQTCMDPATANCFRRSLGVKFERVEVLLDRVVFLERLRWFCFACCLLCKSDCARFANLSI
jgi:hypothetical protein